MEILVEIRSRESMRPDIVTICLACWTMGSSNLTTSSADLVILDSTRSVILSTAQQCLDLASRLLTRRACFEELSSCQQKPQNSRV